MHRLHHFHRHVLRMARRKVAKEGLPARVILLEPGRDDRGLLKAAQAIERGIVAEEVAERGIPGTLALRSHHAPAHVGTEARAGERHVGEATILRQPLHIGARGALCVARRPMIEHHAIGLMYQQGLVGLEGERVVQRRTVDDVELQPLALVDREDLHRLRISLETQLGDFPLALRVGPAGGDPAQDAVGIEVIGHSRRVHQLRDMPEIGHAPITIGAAHEARQDVACGV